jgi:hypothetical protein
MQTAPFDLKLARAPIFANATKAKADSLRAEAGKELSVQFLPFCSGEVAKKVIVGR